MKKYKVSIIVPVYNVRDFLCECVNSLIVQTYDEIEVILVNDGSTDGSEVLCRELADKDSRIKVINQLNAGLSAARNKGILCADGEYILFVDSDDYIRNDTIERLVYSIEEDVDIVAGNEIKLIDGKEVLGLERNLSTQKLYSGCEFLRESMKNGNISMCAPFALYKKRLLNQCNLTFKEGILHEDEQWTPRVYLKAKKVKYVDYPFYIHRYRSDSITHKKDKSKNCEDLINTCFELYDYYKTLPWKYKKWMNNYLCTLYLSALYIGRIINANKAFALKTSYTIRNRAKAILYTVSPRMYMMINDYGKNRNAK